MRTHVPPRPHISTRPRKRSVLEIASYLAVAVTIAVALYIAVSAPPWRARDFGKLDERVDDVPPLEKDASSGATDKMPGKEKDDTVKAPGMHPNERRDGVDTGGGQGKPEAAANGKEDESADSGKSEHAGCPYAGPYENSFLLDHADPQHTSLSTLEEAKKVCDAVPACTGITKTAMGFSPRRGKEITSSHVKEQVYMRQCPEDLKTEPPKWMSKPKQPSHNPNYFDGSTAPKTLDGDIEEILRSMPLAERKAIYFFRINMPNAEPGSVEKSLSDVPLCSVESIARLNPDYTVFILSNTLEKFPEDILAEHSNIRIVSFNATSLVEGTILEEWYHWNAWFGGYARNNLSNGLRMALVWKYTGMYVDSDVISFRPINRTDVNGPQYQGAGIVNNCVLAFWDEHARFLTTSMNRFHRTFDAGIWGHNGPDLMTRVYYDELREDQHLIPRVGYQIIPWFNASVIVEPLVGHKPWYDTTIQWAGRYYNASHLWDVWMKDGYGVHLYNNLIKGHYGRVKTDSVMWHLFSEFCPITLKASTLFVK